MYIFESCCMGESMGAGHTYIINVVSFQISTSNLDVFYTELCIREHVVQENKFISALMIHHKNIWFFH